jgi:hypothetical protein
MFTPLKLPLSDASFINLLNPSSIKRKRGGDKENTSLKLLPNLKKGEVAPLIKIAKDTKVMHLTTHTTNL